MSVTFVIGRAGSGKTLRCFSRIVDALRSNALGPPIYWLLPRQATFEAEHRLTCGSGLLGFCRARVVSFAQFGKEILGEAGGSEVPAVTGIGRQMILGHLLRRHASKLAFFQSVERQAGLAAELDATFDELERAGKTAADLATLLEEMTHSGPLDVEQQTLAAKLADVRLLYDAYNAFLGQDRLDPHRRLEQVREAIASCPSLAGATIHVDGFLEFTDHERKMLAALAGAGAAMEITLVMDPACALLTNPHLLPDEMGLFHRTETTYRRLWFTFAEAHIPVSDPVLLTENPRFESPMLARLEREMFATSEVPISKKQREKKNLSSAATTFRIDDEAAIHRIEAPDRAAEVDAVARHIRSRLKNGDRLRDMAVLMRNLENYQSLIARSFQEHGIPYFLDHRRPAAHHPLIQFLRSALQAARFDWHHDSVIALMKTTLAGLSLDEADELENYILLHRVGGAAWESAEPGVWRRDLLRGESDAIPAANAPDAFRIDALRRKVSDGLGPLVKLMRGGTEVAPNFSIRLIATEIFAMFERFGVRQSLARWTQVSGPLGKDSLEDAGLLLEQRDEHEQVWNCLVELFDQMVDLLGDEKVTPADFVDIVESGLEGLDLGTTPPTVDQVLVGPADRTRCPPVKTVFVLGLNEGEFPAIPRETSVLSDRERRELGRHRLELDPDGRRRLLDERLLAYVTLTQPSRHLILSRSLGDDAGGSLAPSAFWHRIEALFPQVTTERVARESSAQVGQIATPRQLMAGLMQWSRGEREQEESGAAAWLALYQWLVTHGGENPAVLHLRTHAWRALSYTNDASLAPEVATSFFPAPLSLGATQLETMAACPFKHFVRYGLKLASRERAEVSGADLGQVYHRLLARLVEASINATDDSDSGPLAISADAIHAAAVGVARDLRGELMLSTARNRYLLQRVERTLADVIASQRAMMKRSRYRPEYTGVSFGQETDAMPPIRVQSPRGAEVSVHGRIDRVDTLGETDEALVIDYGLGDNTLSLQHVYYGLSLQLLASLLVLQASGDLLGGKVLKPTAAFYLRLLRSFRDIKHPDDALDPTDERFLLAVKPRGLFDARALHDLDTVLESGPSLAVQAYLKQDGKLGYPGSTDAAGSDDFHAILRSVGRRIGKLADEVMSGNVAITPYRLARKSPCPKCEYRGVCRFETSTNRYHHLIPLGREQVLEKLRQEGADGK